MADINETNSETPQSAGVPPTAVPPHTPGIPETEEAPASPEEASSSLPTEEPVEVVLPGEEVTPGEDVNLGEEVNLGDEIHLDAHLGERMAVTETPEKDERPAGAPKVSPEQLEANLARKEELCARAEALSESDEWKATAGAIKALQAEWKTVGPVPKERSTELWERFRKAGNHFFERRQAHFQDRQRELEENLR